MPENPLRICNQCGWAHFPVSRDFAETDAREFAAFILTLTPEQQADYGIGPLSDNKTEWTFQYHVSHYEQCFLCCNPCSNFRDATEADCIPNGVTLQGIIVEHK